MPRRISPEEDRALLQMRGTPPEDRLTHSRIDDRRDPTPGSRARAGSIEDWALERRYALDFVDADRVEEFFATHGRPLREPPGIESWARSRGYAVDFVPQDNASVDSPKGGIAAPRTRGSRSSVEANRSDPNLVYRLTSGPGLLFVGARDQNVARRDTIRAIEAVGRQWAALHPNGPRMRVGGIGAVYGGPLPTGRVDESGNPRFHKSHQTGVDVDVRLMRADGREADTNWRLSREYSGELTAELIGLFQQQAVLPIDRVFFNDSRIPGVERQIGHGDHFHVRFLLR